MWEIVDAILELFGVLSSRRVTVADRYAMKRKVRELRKKEKERDRLRKQTERASSRLS